jgi:large conductance mechanosensitive channel
VPLKLSASIRFTTAPRSPGEPRSNEDLHACHLFINDSVFQYGAFVNALFAFLAIALVVFFFVVRPVNAMIARAKEEPPADPSDRKCPECLSEISLAASRCAFCAGQSAPEAA